ncbi:8960_t:CDS:1, partial [Cetraspora pellucida]
GLFDILRSTETLEKVLFINLSAISLICDIFNLRILFNFSKAHNSGFFNTSYQAYFIALLYWNIRLFDL